MTEPEYDCAIDPAAIELPELYLADLSGGNPSDPDDDDFDQDDLRPLEGLGGSRSGQVWKRAVERVVGKIRDGASNDVGYCLREIRTVNEVDSLYLSAKESLYGCAPDLRHRIGDWSKVPRGSIVYFDSPSSRYGHITEALGGGFVGSTDWPRARWGKVSGGTLKSAWGYTVAYWTPEVNNVRVWWPRPDDQPEPRPEPRPEPAREPIHEVIRRLAHIRRRHVEAKNREGVRALTAAIRQLHNITDERD
jgi:hypothetical protein